MILEDPEGRRILYTRLAVLRNPMVLESIEEVQRALTDKSLLDMFRPMRSEAKPTPEDMVRNQTWLEGFDAGMHALIEQLRDLTKETAETVEEEAEALPFQRPHILR